MRCGFVNRQIETIGSDQGNFLAIPERSIAPAIFLNLLHVTCLFGMQGGALVILRHPINVAKMRMDLRTETMAIWNGNGPSRRKGTRHQYGFLLLNRSKLRSNKPGLRN